MKKTFIVVLFILFCNYVSGVPGEVAGYPLDWRYDRFEPSVPLLGANPLEGARVSASGQWSTFGPEKVLDGDLSANSHWACEQLPAVLSVELKEKALLGFLKIWFYYGDSRVYKFFVETSPEGGTWQRVVDWSDNQKPATADGFDIAFEKPVSAKFMRVTITDSSKRAAGGHIVELRTGEKPAGAASGLQGRAMTTTRISAAEVVGDTSSQTVCMTAWRNERVNGQVVLWSFDGVGQVRLQCGDLLSADGGKIGSSAVKARFVRFVLGNGKLLPDVLDPVDRIDIPAGGYRPVWLTVSVPGDARPGLYKGALTVRGAGQQRVVFPIELNVLAALLPDPAEWSFYLDLWQHPWAVARYHRVEPFSREHYELLRPILTELAQAGQKTLTTSIVERPWNQQTFDPYGSMITHVKNPYGTWSFDFSLFDEYVAFGASCGLDRHIHCYTMVTWGNMVSYTDGASGDRVRMSAVPGTEEHTAYWGPFLREFEKHLKQKGWLERTYIAMDERGAAELRATMKCISEYAPGLKVSMAGNHPPSTFKGLVFDNYSQSIGHVNPALLEEARQRRKDGRITTFYVCCGPRRPNTFTFSPSAEQLWLGYYAAANGLDGFLRWAFAHWPRDPLYNTAFGSWPDGDTFLFYPGARSSIRWECLRDGIEEFEKIRILREKSLVDDALDALLKEYDFKKTNSYNDEKLAELVEQTRAAVQRQSAGIAQ